MNVPSEFMPIDNLAKAIVMQAAVDYKCLRRRLHKDKDDCAAASEIKLIKKFFKSDWFNALCNLDGDIIIKEIENNLQKRSAKIRF